MKGGVSDETGAERSEAEVSADERRGRPGRRSVEDRASAVLELLSGKAGVDELARRFGVHPSTVEKWRQDALEGSRRRYPGSTIRTSSGRRRC